MKRIITLMLVFALMLSMVACSNSSQKYAYNNDANKETRETTDSEDDTSATQAAEQEAQKLTAALIIKRTNTYLAENNLDPVSNVETKSGTEKGQEITSFICVDGLVSVNVTDTSGIVDYVVSLCLPSQVMQKTPSNSLTEAAIGAYAYCMIPLFSCEPKVASSWHQEQFANAPDEGDSSVVIRSYTSKEWFYTAMIAESFVTCIAARYCSQCKKNAPNVSFTSGAKICDICNNQSHNDIAVNDNNTSNGGSTSSNSNPSNGGNTTGTPSNGGNTSQQTTVCSHNYTAATCDKPQTCTLCGQTKGYASGDHIWEFSSCTTEKVCKTCRTKLMGSTPGHSWKRATCTEPERCTVCNETRAAAHGHQMRFTKCLNCDYTDYSCIAGTYTNISVDAYRVGTTTRVDVTATNISVSNSGVLSFTCNGKNYELSVKQTEKSQDHMGYFNCYSNGTLVEDVDFRAGSQLYYNAIYLDRFIVDDCEIYIYATR